MVVITNNTTYETIRNLKFAPETDVTGMEIPVNGFSVEIKSEQGDPVISQGDDITLKDEKTNTVWAKYQIIRSERTDEHFVKVEAESLLRNLDGATMPAEYYEDWVFSSVVREVFSYLTDDPTTIASLYSIDSDITDVAIDGYAPEQTARERLQWALFIAGAYVKSYFSDKVEIKKVPTTAVPIPDNNVFWRPTNTQKDIITAVVLKVYTYTPTQSDPASTDEWVKDEYGNVYIQTSQEVRVEDTAVTTEYPLAHKEVKIDKVTLVNNDNYADIISRLTRFYFNNYIELDTTVVDAEKYLPGELCAINRGIWGEVMLAHVKSADFIFGSRKGAKLKMKKWQTGTSVNLIIIYIHDGEEVYRTTYKLPGGYSFRIENIYPDVTEGKIRTVYYPVNDYAEGTTALTGDTEVREICHPALVKNKKKLYIYDVDAAEKSSEELRIS